MVTLLRRLVEPTAFTGIGMRIIRVLAVVVVSGLAACADPTEPGEPPPSLEIVGGDGQQALGHQTLVDSLHVSVMDHEGKPIPGVLVDWRASSGAISPSRNATDAAGVASAEWAFYSPTTGPSPVGTHRAIATIVGGDSVVFIAHARAGVVLRAVSITPDRVNVSSGAATVTMAVHVTDDRTGLGVQFGSVQFHDGTPASSGGGWWVAGLTLVSGSPADGVWQGTITVPQGAGAGVWTVARLTIGWGCGTTNRRELFSYDLATAGMPYQFTVMADPSQPNLVPAPPPGEASLKLSVSNSCS